MLHPVRIYDKNGKLKKTIPVEQLNKDYWNNINKSKGFTSFGKSKKHELTRTYG
jgi:hypothetical protein|tara:strand:- start:220 stop:381 length:162 start_codon:yes stop_codon:yes gene_type:complete